MTWMSRARKWITRARFFAFVLALAILCAVGTAVVHEYDLSATFGCISLILCIPLGIAISTSLKTLNRGAPLTTQVSTPTVEEVIVEETPGPGAQGETTENVGE